MPHTHTHTHTHIHTLYRTLHTHKKRAIDRYLYILHFNILFGFLLSAPTKLFRTCRKILMFVFTAGEGRTVTRGGGETVKGQPVRLAAVSHIALLQAPVNSLNGFLFGVGGGSTAKLNRGLLSCRKMFLSICWNFKNVCACRTQLLVPHTVTILLPFWTF